MIPNDDEKVRALCIAPRWLGDAILARGALHGLGRSGVTLEVLGRGASARVLGDLPGVVRVHCVPEGSRRALVQDAARLRGSAFEAALVLPGSFSTAWAAFRSGAGVRVGHGSTIRRFLLTRAVAPPGRRVHLAAQYLELAKALIQEVQVHHPTRAVFAIETGDRAWEPPLLQARPEELEEARRLFESHGVPAGSHPLIVAPGARFGPAKRYPPERFARAADQVSQRLGLPVLLVGTADDGLQAALLRRDFPGAIDLTGRTSLGGLIGILASSAGLLSNDSGAMHLAAALGVRVVGVFGSTEPAWTRPLGPRATYVRNPVWCSPCYGRTCVQDFACMLDLPPERLAETFLEQEAPATDNPGRTSSLEDAPRTIEGDTAAGFEDRTSRET